MSYHRAPAWGLLLTLGVPLASQQTQVDLRTQSKSVDFAGAPSTRPFKTGSSLPPSCEVGELFFRTGVAAGSNLYGCTGTNQWSLEAGGGGGGGSLPDMAGHANKVLSTDGAAALWRAITAGPSGALQISHAPGDISVDIVTAVLPQKSAANTFTGLNTFSQGFQLAEMAAPASPADGRIWYDSASRTFRCRQNGVTYDCIGSGGGGGSGLGDPGSNGVVVRTGLNTTVARTITGTSSEITVTNGDGVSGNPTISLPDITSGAYSWWTNLRNPVPSASAAQVAGTNVRVFLVELPGKQTFSKGSVNIETAYSGGNLRVGVYSMSGGVCGSLLFQTGNISTTSAGVQSGTFTPTQLPAGFYYMAIAADNATVTARGYPSGTVFNDLLNAGSLKYIGVAANAASFPSVGLPSTCGGMTPGNQAMPGMLFSQ